MVSVELTDPPERRLYGGSGGGGGATDPGGITVWSLSSTKKRPWYKTRGLQDPAFEPAKIFNFFVR